MKEDLKEPLQLLSKRCRSRDLIKQQDWDGFHKLLTKVEKAMIADGRGDNSHSASNQSFGITGSALFVMTVASEPFVTPMNVLSTGFGPSTFQPKRSTGAPYQQPLGNSQPPSPSQSSAEVPESINMNQLAVSNQNTSTSTKHGLRIRELDSRQRPLDEIKTDFTERHFKRCPKNHCDKDCGGSCDCTCAVKNNETAWACPTLHNRVEKVLFYNILDCQKFSHIVQNSDINPTAESMNTRQQTLNNIEVMGEPSMGGVDSRANAGGGGRSLTQQDLSAIASLINIGVKQQQIANKDVEDAAQGRHPLNRN